VILGTYECQTHGHHADTVKVTITDRLVKALQPAAATKIIYDTEVRGSGVRITPAGVKAFVLNYSIDGRDRRRLTFLKNPRTVDRGFWSCAAIARGVMP
jgi:hypothetical protein